MKSKIVPIAMGSTNLYSGMNKINEFRSQNKKKLAIIVTDGVPDNIDYAKSKKEEIEKTMDISWLPICFGPNMDGKLMEDIFGNYEIVNDISELHKVIGKLIKKKVVLR